MRQPLSPATSAGSVPVKSLWAPLFPAPAYAGYALDQRRATSADGDRQPEKRSGYQVLACAFRETMSLWAHLYPQLAKQATRLALEYCLSNSMRHYEAPPLLRPDVTPVQFQLFLCYFGHDKIDF